MTQIYYWNENKQIEESIDQIREQHPNASIPDDADLSFIGYHKIYSDEPVPSYNPLTEGVFSNIITEPIPGGVRYVKTWAVYDLPIEQQQQNMLANAEMLKKSFAETAQYMLDEFARSRGYDNILSACTYITSPVAKFAVDAQIAVNLRSAMWDKLYDILAEVEAGTREIPAKFDDIKHELPVLTWDIED